MSTNDNSILICGKSASGKSSSLRGLDDPTNVMYLGCEAGKKLPFPAKFKQGVVTHPRQIYQAFDDAENMPDVHTIVIDSQTYLMDMFETKVVLTSANTMKAWSDYAQYFKTLMMQYVATSTKNVIMTAHTMDILNESEMVMETYVPVKGSLKNMGIESYFCNVISCKKMPVRKLDAYKNPLLVITPEEEALGFKYVFQTKLTKETVNERIRGPIDMWDTDHTYIDNDIQKVLDHLHIYYT